MDEGLMDEGPMDEEEPDVWLFDTLTVFETYEEMVKSFQSGEFWGGLIFAGRDLDKICGIKLRPGGEAGVFSLRAGALRSYALSTFEERPLRVYVQACKGGALRAGDIGFTRYPKIPERVMPKFGYATNMLSWVFAGQPYENYDPRYDADRQYDKPIEMSWADFWGVPGDASNRGVRSDICDMLSQHFVPVRGTYLNKLPPSDHRTKSMRTHSVNVKGIDFMKYFLKPLKWIDKETGKVNTLHPKDIMEMFNHTHDVNAVIFDPTKPNPGQEIDPVPRTLNSFVGTTKDQNGFDRAAEDALRQCSPFHDLFHFYVVRCGEDIRTFLLLYMYLVANAQDPNVKIPAVIMFTGPQNTLKTVDMYRLVSYLPYETRMGLRFGQIQDLVGHSTGDIDWKLALTMDEGGKLTAKEAAAVKEIATSKQGRKRKLYQNPTTVTMNFSLFFVTCELEHIGMGSNTLFGRRDFTAKAWPFWMEQGAETNDWYIKMFFNFHMRGEISTDECRDEVSFQEMMEVDVLKYPGHLSSYNMRLLAADVSGINFEGIMPFNMTTLMKQISICERGKKSGDKTQLFRVLQDQSVGDWNLSWEFVDDRSEVGRAPHRVSFLRVAIAQVAIKEWVQAVHGFESLLNEDGLLEDLELDIDFDGLCPRHLRLQADSWPDGNSEFYPKPGLDDPYGRCAAALRQLRGLWDVRNIRETHSRERFSYLNSDYVCDDLRERYSIALGYLQYLDAEMSREPVPDLYKSHMTPESVWCTKHKMIYTGAALSLLWGRLIHEGTYKDLTKEHVLDADGMECKHYYTKIRTLVERGEFANHAWRMQAPVNVYAATRREGRGGVVDEPSNASRIYVMFVPSFAAMKRSFVHSAVPGRSDPYTVFAPNCLFSASASELAFSTGLRDFMSPWNVVTTAARVLIEGKYKNFDDLVRLVVFQALFADPPDEREGDYTFNRQWDIQQQWREDWAAYDDCGSFRGHPHCPFATFPTKFSMLPRNQIVPGDWNDVNE